jgi:hypothetical protein
MPGHRVRDRRDPGGFAPACDPTIDHRACESLGRRGMSESLRGAARGRPAPIIAAIIAGGLVGARSRRG